MLPQDEYVNSDGLCAFINQFGITQVFTVSPESEWKKIYSTVDFTHVQFFAVLTGYLDEKTLTLIDKRAKVITHRTIDISYRAGSHRPWLGKHGMLKAQLADVFNEKTRNTLLQVDISVKPSDTIVGDKWYDYLLSSKYTIGVEGGASVLDKDISIRERTVKFMQEHPDAAMDEIENNCFPGMDSNLQYFAISPRHLEACATKTCQILIEGHYNGILQPHIHYIELKNDFSNVDEVIELVQKDKVRHDIVERSYRDVVLSGQYTYKAFVQFIIRKTIGEEKTYSKEFFTVIKAYLLFNISYLDDLFSNTLIAGNEMINKIFNITPPDSIFKNIKRILRY
jgi:hypothetical protein